MKTFVVAYISFMDNELEMKKVEGKNSLEACYLYMVEKYPEDNHDWALECEDMETLKQACFDGDSMINAIEV